MRKRASIHLFLFDAGRLILLLGFAANELDAFSLNNITAKKSADGSTTIQYGGCDGKTTDCLLIMPGWNYTVRLYRPRKEILDGTWKFPEAQPAAP